VVLRRVKSNHSRLSSIAIHRCLVSERIFNSVETGQAVPITIIEGDHPLHTVGKVDSARVWRVPLWNFENTIWGLTFTGFGIYLCVGLYGIPLFRYLREMNTNASG